MLKSGIKPSLNGKTAFITGAALWPQAIAAEPVDAHGLAETFDHAGARGARGHEALRCAQAVRWSWYPDPGLSVTTALDS